MRARECPNTVFVIPLVFKSLPPALIVASYIFSRSILTGLSVTDSVIVPIQCEYFALEGLGKLLNTIKVVQQKFNIELEIEGLLLTMYDTRLRLANQVVEEVKAHFQDMVFKTIIHRNVRLGESPSFGETIVIHDATSKGAINYINLANEVLQKNTATV